MSDGYGPMPLPPQLDQEEREEEEILAAQAALEEYMAEPPPQEEVEEDDNQNDQDAPAPPPANPPEQDQEAQQTLNYLFFHAVLQRPPAYTTAERALQRGAHINAEFEREGIFPIDIASVNNDQQLMRFLIQHGADANQRAFDGMSPLHRAVIFGQVPMVELLLDVGRVNPNLPTKRPGQEDVTPLQMVVSQNGSVALARCLVQHGAAADVRRENGRTLLHLVEGVDMLNFLLDEGGLDVHAQRDNGCTALHQACLMGNLPVVQGLVRAGGDPNALNRRYNSPLHYACHEGHLETVQWLVRHGGGDPFVRGELGCVVLHIACLTKQTQVALWFIDYCGMKPSLTNKRGHDALHYACKYSPGSRQDATELVRELLKRDPELGKGDPFSVPTALHFAAEWSPELCRLLVKDYGFDLMAKSILGSVPLYHATTGGTVETMNTLIDLMKEEKHDLNVGDVRGLTALHEAVLAGSLRKVLTLLHRGLNVNAVSHCGETPLHAASLTMGSSATRQRESARASTDSGETLIQTQILESVVARGAYALSLDQDKMYPFMYAAKKGNLTKTFVILRAAASQGLFGNPEQDTLAQKTSLKRKARDAKNGSCKRRKVGES